MNAKTASFVLLMSIASIPAMAGNLTYNPDLGTLPSGQGWTYFEDDPSNGLSEINYIVVGGNLQQGNTGNPWNLQYYGSNGVTFNFAQDAVKVAASLQILSSTLRYPGPPLEGNRRAGWSMNITDSAGRAVYLYVGESALFMLGKNEESTELLPFTTTDGFHKYELMIDNSGARLFIDNAPTASLMLNQFRTDGQTVANTMFIGDLTHNEYSSARLNGFGINVSQVPLPPSLTLFGIGLIFVMLPSRFHRPNLLCLTGMGKTDRG